MNQREKNVKRIIDTYFSGLDVSNKNELYDRLITIINNKPTICTVGILENMLKTVFANTKINNNLFSKSLYLHIITLTDDEIENIYFDKNKYNYFCDKDELSEMLDENFTYKGYSKPYIKKIITDHIIRRRTPIRTISLEIKRTFENGKKIGLSEIEIVKLMDNFSTIISKDDWHYKYLMLAMVPDKDKHDVLMKKEFWIPQAKTIYSKICIINDFANGNSLNYNTLFHITNSKFESKFQLSNKTGVPMADIDDFIRNYSDIWNYSDDGSKTIKPEVLDEILSWGDNEQYRSNFSEELESLDTPKM